MLLYKGVAPGTHNAGDAVAAKPFASSTVDPRRNGFHGDRNMPDNHNSVLRHIASYSWPSPYVSASMSFAVASDYAGSGGWVFEIDLASDPSIVINPLEVLTKNFTHIHEHNGHQDLAHGVIDPATYAWILATPPLVGGTGSSAVPHFGPPSVTKPLTAILNAVRDSELLLRNVPNMLVLGNVYLVP
jgi:hypothetical protein